jgi:sortase (surface protein transpeptidase)
MLALMLALTLAFAWRDGVPKDVHLDPIEPTQLRMSSIGQTLPGLQNLSAWASTTEVAVRAKMLEPTAPPAQLLIPALDVHRAVEAVGVDRNGVLDLPVNVWNAGWYKGGPVPGATGDAVIEGHAGYPGHPLIFGRLAALRPGDRIVVVLSDGSQRLFQVESIAVVPAGTAPQGLADPHGPPRLTLLTCIGRFDANSLSYSHRLVVEASYVGVV